MFRSVGAAKGGEGCAAHATCSFSIFPIILHHNTHLHVSSNKGRVDDQMPHNQFRPCGLNRLRVSSSRSPHVQTTRANALTAIPSWPPTPADSATRSDQPPRGSHIGSSITGNPRSPSDNQQSDPHLANDQRAVGPRRRVPQRHSTSCQKTHSTGVLSRLEVRHSRHRADPKPQRTPRSNRQKNRNRHRPP